MNRLATLKNKHPFTPFKRNHLNNGNRHEICWTHFLFNSFILFVEHDVFWIYIRDGTRRDDTKERMKERNSNNNNDEVWGATAAAVAIGTTTYDCVVPSKWLRHAIQLLLFSPHHPTQREKKSQTRMLRSHAFVRRHTHRDTDSRHRVVRELRVVAIKLQVGKKNAEANVATVDNQPSPRMFTMLIAFKLQPSQCCKGRAEQSGDGKLLFILSFFRFPHSHFTRCKMNACKSCIVERKERNECEYMRVETMPSRWELKPRLNA